jgi:hypothetical protein
MSLSRAAAALAVAALLLAGAAHAQDAPPPGEPPEPATIPPPPPSEAPQPAPLAPPPGTIAPQPGTIAPLPAPDAAQPPSVEAEKPASKSRITGGARAGLYTDSDQTTVFRALAAVTGDLGHWIISGTAAVDVISSSSIDVRSSPALSKVDVTTSASGTTTTSGGKMSDRRLLAIVGSGWHDASGHAVNLSTSYANERDYNSLAAGINTSIDAFERATTFMGGFNFTYNWIASVLDPSFAKTMYDLGWSAGVAHVLTRGDALRLRYDGAASRGYQASPYRNVRFGDWTAGEAAGGRIIFGGTIGPVDGYAETLPDTRIRHAAVLEWVHSFLEGLALYSQARLGIDSWGIESLTASVELRAATTDWRFRLGYRFYAQSGADFYQTRYLLAPTNYRYFTSDKELSPEQGHITNLGVSRILKHPHYSGDTRVLLDGTLNILYYTYPDFYLMHSRTSGFFELGLTWEL